MNTTIIIIIDIVIPLHYLGGQIWNNVEAFYNLQIILLLKSLFIRLLDK